MVTAKAREEGKPQMVAKDYMCWQEAGKPWEGFQLGEARPVFHIGRACLRMG